MHENPLSAGPAKDRNHFAGCLLRGNRSSGQSHAQSRPRHLHPGPGDFVVSGTSTVNGSGVTLILTSRTRSDYGAIDLRAGFDYQGDRASPRRRSGNLGYRHLGRRKWVGHQRHPRRRHDPEYQRRDLLARPASRIFRRVTLRHRVQPADSAHDHLHRKFPFPHDCAGVGLSEPDPPSFLAE